MLGHTRGSLDTVPTADERFFEIFLPREIKLMQYHSGTHGEGKVDDARERFFGLFLIRLELTDAEAPASEELDLSAKMRHLMRVITSTIRYSDIPGQLNPLELVAVLREIDPSRARSIARRLLSFTTRSRPLTAPDVRLRMGYVVYPFSTEPDLAPMDWHMLLDLARRLSRPLGSDFDAAEFGHGLIRGQELIGTPTIPEVDIVSLAMTDLVSLIRANLLELQPLDRAEV